VLSEKGTETVKLKSIKGENEGDTGHACISAAGDKLPFWILTKAKTDLCHRKFRAHDDIIIRHNPAGWTNEDMMLEHLLWLSEWVQGNPVILVLDVYLVHWTSKMQERVQELHIELRLFRLEERLSTSHWIVKNIRFKSSPRRETRM
jgi:hypothetical protein